jgi:hypothetical protein
VLHTGTDADTAADKFTATASDEFTDTAADECTATSSSNLGPLPGTSWML